MIAIHSPKFRIVEIVDQEGDTLADISLIGADTPEEALFSAGWDLLGDWRPSGSDLIADLIEA